ncbi:hypothetical protein RHMOL_Rhmol10G0144900 [Rhododendron molle]|uniref:Uncharacterized protein n=1 Tax=Rhododendron molle TaxID=49168 RepID=A0ACC0M2H7_RHOML|nr:hypothetical protein RHMOL_Rhmol10G0144900 [Rhododendron molle]
MSSSSNKSSIQSRYPTFQNNTCWCGLRAAMQISNQKRILEGSIIGVQRIQWKKENASIASGAIKLGVINPTHMLHQR